VSAYLPPEALRVLEAPQEGEVELDEIEEEGVA
jgi:hypothetical protein